MTATRLLHSRSTAAAVLAIAVFVGCLPWSTLRGPVFAKRGTAFTMLASAHLQDAMLGGPSWRDAPLAWPLRDGITQVDWVGGIAVLGLPFRLVGVDPFTQHTLLVLVALFATGLACVEAARALLGPGVHTWIAGIAAALNPATLGDAEYGNLLHHEAMVAGAALLVWGLHQRRWGPAAAGGAFLAGGMHFGVYVGLHGWLAALCVVAVAAVARRGSAPVWAAAAVGFVVVGLTLVPVLSTYADARALYGIALEGREVELRSVPITSLLGPIPGVWLHAPAVNALGIPPSQDPLNPGYGAAALAAFGLWRFFRDRARTWVWWAILATGVAAALVALGPRIATGWGDTPIPGPAALLSFLPGGDALRSPFRWLPVAWLAVALFAALGFRDLVARRWGRVVASVAAVLVVLEVRTADGLVPVHATDIHPVYRALQAVTAPGALYDVGAGSGGDGTERILAAFAHGRPRLGGAYARTSGVHDAVNALARRWPHPAADDFFRLTGTTVVLRRGSQGRVPADAACRPVAGHRLCELPAWPTVSEASEQGSGSVVAVRWPEAPRAHEVVLRCGDAEEHSFTDTWRVLGLVRSGVDVTSLDAWFRAPCAGAVTTEPPGAVPLFAAPDAAPWPRLPEANPIGGVRIQTVASPGPTRR